MKADEQFLQELIKESERLIENNELDEARKLLLEILQKHDPENIDAANNYAVTEIMLGNYESAEDLLKQILEKDERNEIAVKNYWLLKDNINLTNQRKCWCSGRLIASVHLDYGKCVNCSTLVTYNKPSLKELANYYSFEKYWYTHQKDDFNCPTIEERAKLDFNDRIPYWYELVNKYSETKYSLFEIGSSHGGFLAYCKGKGILDVEGIEVDNNTCQFSKERFGLENISSGFFPQDYKSNKKFDVVCAFDVLEHMEDPVNAIMKIKEILNIGGTYIIQTPCYRGEDKDWRMFLPIEHVYLFNESSIKKIFNNAGLPVDLILPGYFPEDMFVIGRNVPSLEKSVDFTNTKIVKKKSNLLIAEEASKGEDLTEISENSTFSKVITEVITNYKPKKLIETGTYLGKGTTQIIASILKALNINSTFYSIEVNPQNYENAKVNLTSANLIDKVNLLNGLSLPKELLPDKETLNKTTVTSVEFSDIFIDHPENERVDKYFNETNFPYLPDNLLDKCLLEFEYKPEFVILDSGGHIGFIEFNYVINKIKSDCIIALDDIYHIKHHKSYLFIKQDNRFEIIHESKEKFGFCIAKFKPEKKVNVVKQVDKSFMSKRNINKDAILIIRTDSIGDSIIFSAFLERFHLAYPNLKISIMCQKHISEYYESIPYVNNIFSFDKEKLYLDKEYFDNCLNTVNNYYFELLLNPVYSSEEITNRIVNQLDIPQKIAFKGDLSNISHESKSRLQIDNYDLIETNNQLEINRYKDLLNFFSIKVKSLMPKINLTTDLINWADNFFLENSLSDDKTIALFAGAQFKIRYYKGYGKAISDSLKNYSVLVLGDIKDKEINGINIQSLDNNIVDLTGKISLMQSIALLNKCKLAVGTETSLAHAACALGVRNVIILGGGHFGRFMPYSNLTSVVCLPLKCYGCNWQCKYNETKCIVDIEEKTLSRAISETLHLDSTKPRVFIQNYAIPDDFLKHWFSNFLNIEDIEIIDTVNLHSNITEKISKTELNQSKLINSAEFINSIENEISNNNFNQALEIINNGLQYQPNNLDLLNNLAVVYLLQSKWNEATATLRRILQLDPNNEIALENSKYLEKQKLLYEALLEAENLIEQNNLIESKEILHKILEIEPKYIDALIDLSVIETNLNNYEGAINILENALKIDSKNEVALENFKMVTELKRNYEVYSKRKQLSIVFQGRNDGYMGNFEWRISTSINQICRIIKKHGYENEVQVILVDWGSKTSLIESIDLSHEAYNILEVISVPENTASKYNQDSEYSMVHAINTGIRRAAGQYIMFCDGDTFIQEKTLNELLLSLRTGFINNINTKSNVFLASRYHIPKVFQSNKPSLDQVNDYIEIHKDKLDHDKINLEKFMGTATAYLMHRDIWFELTGFDENLIYWGWFDIDLFYRVKSKYQIYDIEDFGLTFFHLEHYSNSKNRDMLKENPRKINESKMPKLFSPNESKWGLKNEELILKKFEKSRKIDLSKSEINNIIPPEIKNDEFYQEIMKISQQSDITTVLEIGSSAGAGSTEAFVKGLKRNKNKVSLFCMEISKNRFKELEKRYNNYEFVKCYNVSSVDVNDFPSENKVVDFYNNIYTSLNKYPLKEVIRWLKQDIEYVQDSDVPRNGIDIIREQNNIQNFDLVLIDGSEFTGIAELVKVYGAKYILLDDINAFKNYESYKFLEKDTNYQLIKENWKIRNGYAIFKFNGDKLPIHIFTLVLNGEPFIEYHLELFKQLPFKWHWHIIEGVAELKNDTAWSVANGGKIADSFHKNGLSIDGTTEYLDKIKKEYPDKITIYRKKDGFWNGKIEMVNAPLRNIRENCLLLEVDSDELWTFEQIITLRKLFIENPTKTAAYFWCHFYVGETIITTLKNNYSKSPSYEWIRAWNYRPGDQWLTHEPPALCRKFENNNWNDLAKVNPFYHNETESHGLIFHHYAYVLEEQLKFKEIYYGYKNALSYWRNLNSQKKYPVKLRNFFPWVSDNQEVDEINKFGIKSIAYKSANIWKYNYYIKNENGNTILNNNFQLQNNIDWKKASKKIIIDGVIFQLQRYKPAGISRVWISLLSELGKTDLAESIIVLDRDRTAPIISGITNVPISGFLGYEKIEADSMYLQDICDKYNAGIFISTYYTYPNVTNTVMMVHDLIPEVYEWKGVEWDTKKKCIELADSFLSVSKSTAKDLKRYYQLGKKEINIIPNAVSDIFKENNKEQIDFFKIKYGIKKPYFIVSGTRIYHKNIIQFVKAFNSLKNKNNFEILFTGGPPDIETEFLPYLKDVKYQIVYLTDKELSLAYGGAVALVYPSKYEGFGLPILEAMKAGCPVITCKNSSLSEVAEEAAIYIKEDDIGSLTLALKNVQSKQNRSKLIKKGFEQAKKFNWSISASKLYEVLSKELIKDKNNIKISDTKLNEYNSLYYSILSQYELSTALNGLFDLLNTNESLSEQDLYAAEDNLVRVIDDSSILNKLYAVAEKYQDPLLLYIKSLFLEREKEINDTYKCLVSLIKNGFPNWWIVYKVALLANKFNNSKEAIRLLKLVKETKPNLEFIDYKLAEVESTTENVKVTAIVSTYNSSQFIKGCLEDLVNQTLYKKDELEIIIINSGSEENEEVIVNEFIKNHKNIRYYKTVKESIYKAWNRSIKLAKGKYITNANTDDRHRNDALEKMLSIFENDETVDIVYANSLKTVTPNDLFHSQTPKSEIKWSHFDKDLILFGCFIGPHPMWKKELHKCYGFFSEELDVVGDYEFWLRISRESKFHHINEALGLYYYNNKSAEHRNQSLTNDENTEVQKIYLSKYIQSFEDVNRIENKILQLVNNNKENEYYKIVSELLTFRKEELYHENKFFAEIEKLIKSESIESKSLMFPLQSITKNYKGLLRNEKLNFLIDLFTTLEDTNFEINENVQKLLIENNDFYHNTFIKEFIKSKVRNENRESLNDALEIISNHINEKEYEKSIEYLNNLLNSVNNLSDEYRAELIDMIGNIYLVQGNIEQANKFFEKELQINPSSSRACFGLAETFYIAELYEQAKAMYEWAIKNGKNDEITWNKLRIVNKQLNLDENDNSLDLVNIQELLQKAEEFINNDDFENALDILDKILGTDENNIDALNDLSVIFILQNEIESALNVINKVIDLDSENEIAKNNLQVLENKIKASTVN